MPAAEGEMAAFLGRLLGGEWIETPVIWRDGSLVSERELRELSALLRHELDRRGYVRRLHQTAGPRRRAMRLLRSFLTPEQNRQLDSRREFHVTAASGRTYRFRPCTRTVQEVERHGSRFFVVRSFCLHPPDDAKLPAADVTLAQVLLLSADEEEFRAKANISERLTQLWNGDWLRTLARRRRERAARGEV